jgi:hypothetical protein
LFAVWAARSAAQTAKSSQRRTDVEKHLPGSEFGELQTAIWKDQFEALRDGDRFFYGNDPVLQNIESRFGISYQVTLAEIIAENTDLNIGDLNPNVFIDPNP